MLGQDKTKGGGGGIMPASYCSVFKIAHTE